MKASNLYVAAKIIILIDANVIRMSTAETTRWHFHKKCGKCALIQSKSTQKLNKNDPIPLINGFLILMDTLNHFSPIIKFEMVW